MGRGWSYKGWPHLRNGQDVESPAPLCLGHHSKKLLVDGAHVVLVGALGDFQVVIAVILLRLGAKDVAKLAGPHKSIRHFYNREL